jgi:hypothetical protein
MYSIYRASVSPGSVQLLLASRYIALGLTSHKTRPLPSNGCPLLLRVRWNAIT